MKFTNYFYQVLQLIFIIIVILSTQIQNNQACFDTIIMLLTTIVTLVPLGIIQKKLNKISKIRLHSYLKKIKQISLIVLTFLTGVIISTDEDMIRIIVFFFFGNQLQHYIMKSNTNHIHQFQNQIDLHFTWIIAMGITIFMEIHIFTNNYPLVLSLSSQLTILVFFIKIMVIQNDKLKILKNKNNDQESEVQTKKLFPNNPISIQDNPQQQQNCEESKIQNPSDLVKVKNKYQIVINNEQNSSYREQNSSPRQFRMLHSYENISQIENQKIHKKQLFKEIFNQLPDGVAIINEKFEMEFANQSLLAILKVDKKSKALDNLLNLQNCQDKSREQRLFHYLFDALSQKIKKIRKKQDNIEEKIDVLQDFQDIFDQRDEIIQLTSYSSVKQTVKEELIDQIKKQKEKNNIEHHITKHNKPDLLFLCEIQMMCGYSPQLSFSLPSSSIQEQNSNREMLLTIILKPYVQRCQLFVLIIVKDVTLFNEITVQEQINQNKSQMLSQIAHEFRSPLNVIILLSQDAIDNEETDKDMKKSVLQPIYSSANWLLTLINDILDLAQLKAGKFRLVFQDFDLQRLLIDIAAMMTVQCNQKQIKLNLIIELFTQKIKSDPNRIKQIVINLLSNSIKFTSSETGIITVQAKQLNKSQIQIMISDNGIGIKPEDQNKLFQQFGRIESSSQMNTQGVGLGLMICNILAIKLSQFENSGGQIDNNINGLQVYSEGEGKGTSFSFIIYDQGGQITSIDKSSFLNFKSSVSQQLNQYENSQSQLSFLQIPVQNSNSKVDYVTCKSYKLQGGSSKWLEQHGIIEESKLVMEFTVEKPQFNKPIFREPLIIQPKSSTEQDIESPVVLEKKYKQQEIQQQEQQNVCNKVLIVDDVDLNIYAIQMILRKLQLQIDKANNAQEAYKKIKEYKKECDCDSHQNYRLILMDIEMPGDNGIEATKKIRKIEQCKESIIIGCSGHSDEQEKQKCLNAGMNNYLSKPLDSQQVQQLVKSIFQRE